MRSHTLTVSTVALLLAAAVRPSDELRFAPAEKSVVVKAFEQSTSMTSDSFTMKLDDTEIPSEQLGNIKINIEETVKLSVTDEYQKVSGGRPTKLKRTFDTVESKSKQSMGGGEEGEGKGQSKEKTTELSGKSVVFTWDEKKEEFTKAYDDDKGDAALIEGLDEDLDFREFLPTGAVKEAATWDLEAKSFRILVAPGGDLKLTAKDDEDASPELDKKMIENLKGKAKATYKGTRDEGGVSVGVITIEGEIESHGDEDKDDRKTEVRRTASLDGELLWDMKAGHALSFKLKTTDKVSVTISGEAEMGGEKHSISQQIELSGTSTTEMKTGK
jgi:hypothetical protein